MTTNPLMQMKDCERIDIMEDKQSNVCWIYSEKYDLHTYRVSKVECCATPNCPRYWKFTTCRNRSTPVLFVDQFQETMANEWENFQAMEVGDVMNLPENTFIDPDDRQIVQGMYRADIKVTVTPIQPQTTPFEVLPIPVYKSADHIDQSAIWSAQFNRFPPAFLII